MVTINRIPIFYWNTCHKFGPTLAGNCKPAKKIIREISKFLTFELAAKIFLTLDRLDIKGDDIKTVLDVCCRGNHRIMAAYMLDLHNSLFKKAQQ